jgi:hypothetical protein
MPPADSGRTRQYPGAASDRPTTTTADWPPPLIDPKVLAELPVPVQAALATALLPYEVAFTWVKILKNSEALLAELVFHLNALRPAVFGVSQAYAEGQFDQLFRTLDQIQQGTNAVALVWAPLNAVRDRLVPGAPQAATPRAPGYPGHAGSRSYQRPAYPAPRPVPQVTAGPVTVAPAPPSTVEYLGRLGGQLWGQASSLPGLGLLFRPAEPDQVPDTQPLPVTASRGLPAPPEREAPTLLDLVDLAAPLVPGRVKRFFGGG